MQSWYFWNIFGNRRMPWLIFWTWLNVFETCDNRIPILDQWQFRGRRGEWDSRPKSKSILLWSYVTRREWIWHKVFCLQKRTLAFSFHIAISRYRYSKILDFRKFHNAFHFEKYVQCTMLAICSIKSWTGAYFVENYMHVLLQL